MKKTFLFLLVVNILYVSNSLACMCDRKLSVLEARDLASSVFLGEVVSVSTVNIHYNEIVFSIKNMIVGEMSDEISVFTVRHGGMCGIAFERGEKWLIFAHSRKGTLYVNACEGTKRFKDAKEDLKILYGEYIE